jgi:hypothetical protein
VAGRRVSGVVAGTGGGGRTCSRRRGQGGASGPGPHHTHPTCVQGIVANQSVFLEIPFEKEPRLMFRPSRFLTIAFMLLLTVAGTSYSQTTKSQPALATRAIAPLPADFGRK